MEWCHKKQYMYSFASNPSLPFRAYVLYEWSLALMIEWSMRLFIWAVTVLKYKTLNILANKECLCTCQILTCFNENIVVFLLRSIEIAFFSKRGFCNILELSNKRVYWCNANLIWVSFCKDFDVLLTENLLIAANTLL